MATIRTIFFLLLSVCLVGCSYLRAMTTQAGFSLQQLAAPEQRVYKHMLSRETFFVFGRIERARKVNHDAIAVVALSDQFRNSEVVDINQVTRAESYYGLNLPAGAYRLLVVSDLNGDGYYDQNEVVGERALSLTLKDTPDRVLGGFDIDLGIPAQPVRGAFRLEVLKTPARVESLFYPKGTLRSLDDPIFSPQMAELGMYEPAAFLEAAPMMFYALEEDVGYKVPVVFVHGIGGSARDFEAILESLDRTRYRPWFFYYPSGVGLNQLGAMFYKIFLSGKVIPLGEMPMVIVAHSMGGLVVREALNHCRGAAGENHVARLITIASPLGGHPGARSATSAPLTLPSWRDVDPESPFIAGLHRTPLPAGLEYYLLFSYGNDRTLKLGANSDGVVPLASQLTPAAQREATGQQGFDATHTGILSNRDAIREVLRITGEVRAPYPQVHMQEALKGGYKVALGPAYSPLEAYYLHFLGHYIEALASGRIAPIQPIQEHFVRVVQGEVAPNNELESAWLKFRRDYPGPPEIPPKTVIEGAATR